MKVLLFLLPILCIVAAGYGFKITFNMLKKKDRFGILISILSLELLIISFLLFIRLQKLVKLMG
jgi:hypothetical protein